MRICTLVAVGLLVTTPVIADPIRLDRIADRYLGATPPHPTIDLPGHIGQVRWSVIGGADFLRGATDSTYWKGMTIPTVSSMVGGSMAVFTGEKTYLRYSVGYSYPLESFIQSLHVGYQVLTGSFANAQLGFSGGLSHIRYAGDNGLIASASGNWSIEIVRRKKRSSRLRGGIVVGLDLGILIYDHAPDGEWGFMPIRLGAGWYQGHGPMRWQVYFDGSRDNRFRLMFSLGGLHRGPRLD